MRLICFAWGNLARCFALLCSQHDFGGAGAGFASGFVIRIGVAVDIVALVRSVKMVIGRLRCRFFHVFALSYGAEGSFFCLFWMLSLFNPFGKYGAPMATDCDVAEAC